MKAYRILSETEASDIVSQLKDWKPGKAASKAATGTVKQNEEIQWSDSKLAKRLLTFIHESLLSSPLHQKHLIKHIMVPKFNRYANGGQYKSHADAGLMGGKFRTDLACTIFLNNDYEGGELVIDGHFIKGEPGMCVVYECWRLHHVTPVTKGERICAITWMQSHIRDYSQQELMQILQSVMGEIDRSSSEERLYARLSSVYGKLMRMWIS